jgi:hypothetical protein
MDNKSSKTTRFASALPLIVAACVLFADTSGLECQAKMQSGVSTRLSLLGSVPTDELYSTRALSIRGKKGVLIREDRILLSEDGGSNWTTQTKRDKRSPVSHFVGVWVSSESTLFATPGDVLFESIDTGKTWNRTKMIHHASEGMLAVGGSNDGNLVIVVGERSVPISDQAWVELPHYAQGNAKDREEVPAVWVSSDGGHDWLAARLPRADGFLDGVAVSGSSVLVWGPYCAYASLDGGKSWRLLKFDIPEEEEEAYPISGAIAGSRLWISLKNGRLMTGRIGQTKLSTQTQLAPVTGNLVFVNSCVGIATTSSGTAKDGNEEDILIGTENGGRTWTPVMHSSRIVALTADSTAFFGVTEDHVFQIHLNREEVARTCLGN